MALPVFWGPKIRSQKSPSRSGFHGLYLMVSGVFTSPWSPLQNISETQCDLNRFECGIFHDSALPPLKFFADVSLNKSSLCSLSSQKLVGFQAGVLLVLFPIVSASSDKRSSNSSSSSSLFLQRRNFPAVVGRANIADIHGQVFVAVVVGGFLELNFVHIPVKDANVRHKDCSS